MSRTPISTPYIDGRHLEIYSVSAHLDDNPLNNMPISQIQITRALNPNGKLREDVLLFDLKQLPIHPLPFISHQKTHENYKNRGINNQLIQVADNYFFRHFNSHLYSDILFSQDIHRDYPSVICHPGKLVWQNLERNGLAQYIPFENENNELVDRWVMMRK